MQTKQKELIFDIEITPTLSYHWATGGLYDVQIIEVVEDSQILSFAYKWRGEKKIHKIAQCDLPSYVPGKLDDRELVEELIKLFDQADVLIGQNSDKFDIRYVNTRAIMLDIKKPTRSKQLDTKKMANSDFMFPSNALQFLSTKLGSKGKMAHAGFMTMFKGCKAGDMKYWNMLKKYNGVDIEETEFVLDKFLPWYNRDKPTWQTKKQCPHCQGYDTQSKGTQPLRVDGKKHKVLVKRYICKTCAVADDELSGWFNGEQVINKVI